MKEHEIRPKELFEEYLEISKNDIKTFFSDSDSFVSINCPACCSENISSAFIKHGFKYVQCDDCFTLFTSPRPTEDMISKFYKNSMSGKFWAERFFPETAEARCEKIFKPRVDLLEKIISNLELPEPKSLVDVGAGFGIFLEEVNKRKLFHKTCGVEPSVDLAKTCREKDINVIEKAVEEIDENELQASIATSFEVFEHLFNPEEFINSMKNIIKPNGIILFTTLTISGLDLLVLGKNSKSISPPHHINFFSIEGLIILMDRCELEIVEINTPGKLDIDIIMNMMHDNPQVDIPDFIKYIYKHRSDDLYNNFQTFLQQNNLSSHVCVIARKNS